MDPGALKAKEGLLDQMEKDFHENLECLVADVKSTMRSKPAASALQCFELALVFLSQVFPNVKDIGSASEDKADELEKLKEEFKSLKKSQDNLKKNQESLEKSQERFKKNQESLHGKVVQQEDRLDECETCGNSLKSEVKKLTKANAVNSNHILGLRKLQKLFKEKTVQSAPSSGVASASAAAAAPAAAAVPAAAPVAAPVAAPAGGLPQALSQKSTFSVKLSGDAKNPSVHDLKLLPGGLVLLADYFNQFVKLFTTLGQHIYSLGLGSKPLCLAVMDLTSAHSWDVAVTLDRSSTISLLEVTRQQIRVKKSIPTSKRCLAIAAVDGQSLAVGYNVYGVEGIDLMDLHGNILRQLSSDVEPFKMDVSDQCLVISTWDSTLVKLSLTDRSMDFNNKVPQIPNPRGVACLQDGSSLVTDMYSRSIHLVSPDDGTVRQLWRHPGGRDTTGDELWSVSLLDSVGVCSTIRGSVFVFDVM